MSLIRSLEARLQEMADEVAENPFRPQIEEVLEGYAHTRAEAVLAVLADLSTVDVVRLSREARRALLRNLRADLEAALELPEMDVLPGAARGRAPSSPTPCTKASTAADRAANDR